MSLYTKLFGENPDATALLGMIGVTRNEFGRYRDVYLNKEGTKITVLTRCGGINRKDYRQVFNNMMRYENYLASYDDDYDNTYAYFEFEVPQKYAETCKKIAPKEDRPGIKELFQKEIEQSNIPGSPAAKRMEKIAEEIMGAIESGNHFIGL